MSWYEQGLFLQGLRMDPYVTPDMRSQIAMGQHKGPLPIYDLVSVVRHIGGLGGECNGRFCCWHWPGSEGFPMLNEQGATMWHTPRIG